MAFILLVFVTGFTVNKHYCGDELTEISLSTDTGHCLHDVCTYCEDAAMDCRFGVDMLSDEDEYLSENNQPETVFAGLQSTEKLTISKHLYPLRLNDLPTENITGHEIHMFQFFRC